MTRPFQHEILDEERTEEIRDRVTVSINLEERIWLEDVKTALNVHSDSKGIKLGMEAGRNAIKSLFSEKSWKFLMSNRRNRASDYLQKKS